MQFIINLNKLLRLFKCFLFTVIFLWSSHFLLAQDEAISISGKVISTDNEPLFGVNVYLEGTNYGTTTNFNGEYTIKNIKPKTHTIVVSFVGFVTQKKQLNPEIRTYNFKLREESNVIDEVTIKSKTKAEKVKEQSFTVNSIETKLFSNLTTDVNKILDQTSGVRIRLSGGVGSDYDFSLNGLSGKRVRFFLDEIPIDDLGEAYKLYNIPVNFIDRIDVYKGFVPVDLGADALGGAINIISKKRKYSYIDASYSFGSFNTHRLAVDTQYKNEKSGFVVRPKLFFNYSDNNYIMKNQEVYNYDLPGWQTIDVERFHDTYQSFTSAIDIGFIDRKWTDEFLINQTYTQTKEDVQMDVYGNPFGNVYGEETANNISLKYNKSKLLQDKLDIKLYALYNRINGSAIDTVAARYNWLGDARFFNDNSAELNNQKTIFEFQQDKYIGRINAKYDVTENSNLVLNYVAYNTERQGENRLNTDEDEPFKTPNILKKNIVGLAYNINFLDDNLNFYLASKYYDFYIFSRSAKSVAIDLSSEIEDLTTEEENLGVAIGSRYFINPNLYVKASYEKGYRLPDPEEIFGDGLTIFANPELQPEESDNINFGINFNYNFRKNSLKSELSLFWRDVKNFVLRRPSINGKGTSYENVLNVLLYGAELQLMYKLDEKWTFNSNVSRQFVLNNDTESAQYQDHLPNTPYFFGNLGVNFNINPKDEKRNLSCYYNFNYVHEFFLAYESVANAAEKNIIPEQMVQDIGVTLSSKKNNYDLSIECTNLFNATAYDNFNIQKSGRAVYAKLRYHINNK